MNRSRSLRCAARGAWAAALAVVSALAPGPAAAADVKRVDATPSAIPVPDLAGIGQVLSVTVREGRLYVGGSSGIAAVDAQGQVLWMTKLSEAVSRSIDADANGVAYAAFNIVGYERGKGAAGALLWGQPSMKLVTADSHLGLLSGDGKPLWDVAVAETSALSPPALGPDKVAVQGSRSLFLYQRGDGSQVAAIPMFTNYLGLSANFNTRLPVMRPLWAGDTVLAAHQSWFKKVSADGKELDATKELGRNFTFLLTGPLKCKELVVLSEAAYPEGNVFSGKKARVYAANPELKHVWHENTEDDEIGVGDIVCNDESIIAVSNAQLIAFSYDGKEQWKYESKKGVLIPGTQRGIYRAGTLPVAASPLAGRQVVAAGPYLYVTSRAERKWKGESDVVTIFDAKQGSVIQQVDPRTVILDMAVFGPTLALATVDGLKFIAAQP